MRQYIFTKQTTKRIAVLLSAFVLAINVMLATLPSILNQVAHALPVSSSTTSSGFNSLGWTKDRTQPYSYSKTASELRFEVNNTVTSAPSSANFYKWEGFQSNTALPANTDTVRASLYVDPAWATKPVSVSMWGTTTNGTGNAWPIIDFSNGFSDSYSYATSGNFVGFRVYDTNTGVWHEVVPAVSSSGVSYFDKTVDLEIAVNQLTGKYEFYLNGNEIYSYDTQGYSTLTNVTFNNLNLKTNSALDNYVVRWTNFYTGTLTPPAPLNGHFVYAGSDLTSGSTVPYTGIRLQWDTYSVPARYRVTVHNPDTTTTNFQPSTTSSWNPPSIGWNVNDQLRQGYFGAKGEGTYTYTLAVMHNGVWSNESAPLTLIYDISAPVVTYVTPSADNQPLTSSDSIKVVFSDTVGLKQTVLHVYKQDGVTRVASLWQNPYVSGKTQTVELPLTGVADGTYQIRAAAVDNAGHTTQLNRTFIVDSTGPIITVQPGALGNTATNTYREVGFNFYDPNKVAYVTLNGHIIDLTDAVYTNIDNVVQHSRWFGTQEGPNKLIAYDVAGNQSTLLFTVDTKQPTASLSYSNNQTTIVSTDVTVTLKSDEPIQTPSGWTIVDDTTFTKVFADNGKFSVVITDIAGNSSTINGEVKRIDKTPPAFNLSDNAVVTTPSINIVVTEQSLVGGNKVEVDGATVSATHLKGWDYQFTVTGEGAHTVIATDKAGNKTTLNFTIDSIAPKVTISPTNLSVPMDAGTVTVSGTVNDPSIKTVDVLVGKTVVGSAPVVNGKWTLNVPTVNYLVGVDYTITATATDAAGNPGTSNPATLVLTSPVVLPQIASPTSTPGGATFTQPQSVQQPVFTTPQSTANTDPSNQGVEGAQTQKSTATNTPNDQAVEGVSDTKSPLSLWGLAWYWWLVILAALAAIGWWLIAGYRRNAEEA